MNKLLEIKNLKKRYHDKNGETLAIENINLDIYENELEDDILVQGIIDLYYINEKDELVLIDYKTDYVQNEIELVEKYKTQLDIYITALEEALNRRVIKTYIYSTYLDKEIIVK